MKLSKFGQVLARNAPIVQLMDDLGQALNDNPDSLFLGGGNPANVPAAAPVFEQHLKAISSRHSHQQLGIYQSPQGNRDVLKEVASYLNNTCGWDVGEQNIALVGGSQTALFILFNVFCDANNKALLPMVPEYVGYAAQPLAADVFTPIKPKVSLPEANRFKYQVDLDAVKAEQNFNLMCISSPANPSGNVLTPDEAEALLAIAWAKDIPLILDYAYGKPWPGLVYDERQPFWQSGCIAVMSLSKLGLPGARTSVVVADPEVITYLTRANTIISLASGNVGASLLKSLITSGDMQALSTNILPKFYQSQRDYMVDLIDQHLADFPYRLHEPEGAFFLWLWLDGLPVSAKQLYQSLKTQGVIVMPGDVFFFGLEEQWNHAQQCLRLSYCQPKPVLEKAVKVIASTLRKIYL